MITEWSHWMAAAQGGDRILYERLLHDIVPFIRAIVAHNHRRADRVEDVVQDVLLTVHRVRHTYDPKRPFEAWLGAIARRRSIDALRRLGRIGRMEVTDEAAYETFSDDAANRELDRNASTAGLGAALAALPPAQREALELLKLKEMTLSEASRASGKSVAALKVNVHRAVKTLRARMNGERT
jgi:RNA polymerase sigma factor (sigma-70 family)